MKVLALVPGENRVNPGQRFRVEQWEPVLRERGIEITYSPFVTAALGSILYLRGRHVAKAAHLAAAYFRQFQSLFRARRFDLVYVFREATLIGPAVVEPLMVRQGLPVVFDFDDAIFVRYVSPANGYLSYLKSFGKAARLCREAREVMVGNDYLREYALRFNRSVTVIPTSIDVDRYRPERRRPAPDGVPLIGWTGSHSTLQHLQAAAPILSRLARRHRFRLVVISSPGDAVPEMPGVEVEFRPWRAESEVEDLADLEIGIMPLPDDNWTRGKCGLKALQYMALGIPTVASAVGVNTEIVEHGVNGFLAASEEAWIQSLGRLLEDRGLRQKLGAAARQTVLEKYAGGPTARRVAEVFERAVSRTSGS